MDAHLEKQTELVGRLLELADAIRHAVSLADWEGAGPLATQRSRLQSSISAQQTPTNLETIRRIQAIDADLMKTMVTARAELDTEYRNTMARINAATQYHRVALM